MAKVLAALILIVLTVAFLSSPTYASTATDLNSQCNDAIRADDWGTAAAYCQETFEAFMRESRSQHGLIAYEERELADIALGAAGYANLHFDASTGQDQVSRAADDLQQMLDDEKCPDSVRTYVTNTALPLVQRWAQYRDDGE